MTGFLSTCLYVGVEVPAVDSEMLAELDEGDASFGSESSDEPGAGAEPVGGFLDGEQHSDLLGSV